ncbi:hypothetical protein ACUNWD_15750 [Sunxiuqinia sp. A32]|uniref:hypothetical protein n=1 Tax=Sunxiuqinia sp. A32 TaxID=3461496 RepID=UPI0040464957
MKKKVLNRILVVFGVLVMMWMAFPFGMIFALAFWIYLGVLVLRKKPVYRNEMDPELAEMHWKRLKTLMIAAGILFPVATVGIIMHNMRSRALGTEEALFFFIGVIAMWLFVLLSAVGFILFLKGRKRPS